MGRSTRLRLDLKPRQMDGRDRNDPLRVIQLHHVNAIGEDAFDRAGVAAVDDHTVPRLKRMRQPM